MTTTSAQSASSGGGGISPSSSQPSGANNKPSQELLFKVLVVGEYGVGKTAFIRRYCDGSYTFSILVLCSFVVPPRVK
jgi:septin family protein